MVATNNAGGDELAAPLDLLLTSSAVGIAERMMPNTSWSRFALNLARQPKTVASRGTSLGRQLVSIAEGRSDLAPAKGDKRFADAAWQGNPLLRRTMQAYLAAATTVDQLFSDAHLGWRDGERIRFALDVIIEGFSPSNNPLLNPLGYKALIDTGGLSAVRGLRHFVSDMMSAPRVPSMVEPDAFTLGDNIAATAGVVVFRNEVFELIQYAPQTERVWSVPLLMVPPVINKFYILDISPGRSMIEYFVRQGVQVFAISWRNPTAEQRNWGFDTYGRAILSALDAVEKIAGCDRTHLQASCSGGILAAMTAQHLTATGEGDRLAGLTLMVTVLDQRKAGVAAAAIDEEVANIAIALSARKGYLDGRSLAEVFAWLRPTDLVWRYWVNNYVQGKSPAAFDVLFWNADTTRMAAGLHRDMVTMGVHNSLATPGGVTMLGTPVDLGELIWMRTWWQEWLTTFRPGRPVTAAPGCSAARTADSCCPPADTSPRWSTRRETPRPATAAAASRSPIPPPGPTPLSSTPDPGGQTMWAGWQSAVAKRRTHRTRSVGPACCRWRRHPAATCSTTDRVRAKGPL